MRQFSFLPFLLLKVKIAAGESWPCRCGPPLYRAPEILTATEAATAFDPLKLDVWALGVMLFMMLTGAPPWPQDTGPTLDNATFQAACQGELQVLLDARKIDLSAPAVELLQALLRRDPNVRPTIAEVRNFACLLETRGPDSLTVHAPREDGADDQGGDKGIDKSASGGNYAGEGGTPKEKGPMLVFDGYDGAVRIPSERIRDVQVEFSHGAGGEGGGKGRGDANLVPNDTYLKMKALLLEVPMRCIAGANFMLKWRKKHGADLFLPKNVNLQRFLKDAETAGACRLEMRKMSKGPDSLIVHAPGDGGGAADGEVGGGEGGFGGKTLARMAKAVKGLRSKPNPGLSLKLFMKRAIRY